MLGLYWTVWDRYTQVLYLGRAPRTKETLPDFLKWNRVTRRPLVFRGLTGSQRTPGFWGVTLHPGLRKTSRIQHLQLTNLHLFTRIGNTKSMTPNQSRFRAPGFKGLFHIPLGPCSGFKAKRHSIHLTIFFFLFFWKTHWPSYIRNSNLLRAVN